ncbi:hypothetical protein GL263_01945 [Streptomyces durbertensis]|uniref:DUF5709 domain-containing protein n=1 Tax=Streptomyces durbertensis TaxID=2448886 RepID=A0ABR6EAJ2_9ACTN|nr:DUF5709 domain-containing protein [Streptomyces durbertensis]MBB1242343.1 hypothetical protein [Streptomyces durbertensis]
MGDEVYQPEERPQGWEVEDDAAQLDPEDSLVERGANPAIEEGYSPPEKPLAAESWGTTAAEQHEREPLEGRLAREEPDVAAPAGDGVGDVPGGEGEPRDAEVGDRRSGRLVAQDEGVRTDREKDLVAEDVGVDGAAASAEEAAVHTVEEDEL